MQLRYTNMRDYLLFLIGTIHSYFSWKSQITDCISHNSIIPINILVYWQIREDKYEQGIVYFIFLC